MGLFYNNNVAGSGVAKNGPRKKPFFRFWELFANKFWTFFKINLIYFAFCIPLFTVGPATAAMTHVMRNIYLEEPQFVFHEFWKAFKKNFWQAFGIGLVDLIVVGLSIYGYISYITYADTVEHYWFFYALTMSAEIIFLLMNFYIYPQIVALNLNMGAIIKNSLILAFINIKSNLVTLAVFLIYIMLVLLFGLYVLLLTPIVPLAWLAFLSVFNSYPAIQKFIINPFYEQKGEKNPEIPDYDDEEAVFEDMGGKEAPIKIKKTERSGKIIK